jgi:hypothetical protein
MSGHVFHPGHHSLHGVTMVLETHGSRTYVGRFDSQDEAGVHMLDVGIHDADADASAGQPSKAAYLQRTAKYGIRVTQKRVLVPAADIAAITPLGTAGLA